MNKRLTYAEQLRIWEQQRREIVKLREKGKTLAEIAEIFGISHQRVSQKLAAATGQRTTTD